MSVGSVGIVIYPLSPSIIDLKPEPGGYLVWGEYDFQTWRYKIINPTEDFGDELTKLLQYNATFGHTRKPNFQLHKYVFAPRIFL
jgi:hypothetical protein